MLQAGAVTSRRISRALPTANAISRAASTASSSTPSPKTSSALIKGDTSEKAASANDQSHEKKPRKKTLAEADEELRQKLEAMSGDGGEAGIELEGGKPVAMKRGVRENMFRYI
ncbi:MAG: hypothetical protein Q9160_003092 [Pyrenula sp. 1 TL-2023]